jgi:hypothetical protein
MNPSNPLFWSFIGFLVGFVVASGGSISTPLDAFFGGILQAGLWFVVSRLILNKRKKG